ncbi:hypothetical protein N7462_006175 [Penicillium macrosclerotiorum]|uniref:uncharacterized protein n=1 Tax=Penicillium macrosclerotiorum TaxID=303699 RepID=UPI002547CFEE|nr:uncharacterized protein N7462_006175 [Penicillium macrosclerotiorum]KAJ5683010.1 hypothetical protein N7462_006175 [Penicillium macrosclerotiorum]
MHPQDGQPFEENLNNCEQQIFEAPDTSTKRPSRPETKRKMHHSANNYTSELEPVHEAEGDGYEKDPRSLQKEWLALKPLEEKASNELRELMIWRKKIERQLMELEVRKKDLEEIKYAASIAGKATRITYH